MSGTFDTEDSRNKAGQNFILSYILAMIDNDFGTWAKGFHEGMQFLAEMLELDLRSTLAQIPRPDKDTFGVLASSLYHLYKTRDLKRDPLLTAHFDKSTPFFNIITEMVKRKENDERAKKTKH